MTSQPNCPCGDSIDAIFSYDTPKVAVIRDRRLGLTYFGLLFVVFCYIILYLVIYKKRYLLLESPQGIVRTSLHSPPLASRPSLSQLPYCLSDWRTGLNFSETDALAPLGPHPCLWWDAFDVASPNLEESALLITTAVKSVFQYLPDNCSLLDPACDYRSALPAPTYFVANIEDFLLLVDHSFAAPMVGLTGNSFDLPGRILGSDGQIMQTSDASSIGVSGEADVISIRDLLLAADIHSLDQLKQNVSVSYREDGIVLLVSIYYSNTFTYNPNLLRYEYRVSRINGTRFQTTEVERDAHHSNERLLLDRRGIRIVFDQVGELGKFDFPTLLVTVVSGLALVVVASQSLNYTIKWFPPVQRLYRNEIFIDSAGEWGSGAFEVLGEPEPPPTVDREALPPSSIHSPAAPTSIPIHPHALPASPSGVIDLESPPIETAD